MGRTPLDGQGDGKDKDKNNLFARNTFPPPQTHIAPQIPSSSQTRRRQEEKPESSCGIFSASC